MVKKIIKYAFLTVCGVILFIIVNRAANEERTVASIGGEAFFLTLPIMWWAVKRIAKDFINEYRKMWHEIKPDRDESPQEHKQE